MVRRFHSEDAGLSDESWLNLFKISSVLTFHAGGDNNLAVIMGAYKSPSAIQCGGTLNAPQTCIKILDSMLATKNQELFGPSVDPSVTAELPQALFSGRLVNQLPFPFPMCLSSDTTSNRRSEVCA